MVTVAGRVAAQGFAEMTSTAHQALDGVLDCEFGGVSANFGQVGATEADCLAGQIFYANVLRPHTHTHTHTQHIRLLQQRDEATAGHGLESIHGSDWIGLDLMEFRSGFSGNFMDWIGWDDCPTQFFISNHCSTVDAVSTHYDLRT